MIEHAAVPDLKTALDEGRATLIDVREFFEFQAGHVPGAIHMPMHTIPVRMDEIPSSGEVYVICEGVRAINVHGGMGSWRMAGFPTEQAVTA
jgi:rhodanese-related sulfurtransferase